MVLSCGREEGTYDLVMLKRRLAVALCSVVAVTGPVVATPAHVQASSVSELSSKVDRELSGKDGKNAPRTENGRTMRQILISIASIVGVFAFLAIFLARFQGLFRHIGLSH
ncbi:hypothetical protein CFELI_10885 [Corynebacterium felinum]|nr:hypothetical protein CFELI_10885 [Corynebacterium felinum]